MADYPKTARVTVKRHGERGKYDRATVDATLEADGRVTATCRGMFVAVGPDHPAHRRW